VKTMSRITCLIVASALALCAPAARAQAPAGSPAEGDAAMGKVARNAESELNKTIADLNAMRAQIASEKLPMSQQLTALEDEVVTLRKEEQRVQRLVDAGALEIGTMQAEIKSRQDELSYVSSLLDEYVRTFETKIAVGELQVDAVQHLRGAEGLGDVAYRKRGHVRRP